MRPGVYDVVMVLKADQIQKGIVYVRTKIIGFVEEQSYSADEEEAEFEKWDQFWEYFERFWMQDDFFQVWSHPHGVFDIVLKTCLNFHLSMALWLHC
jgi:hypothetical protein